MRKGLCKPDEVFVCSLFVCEFLRHRRVFSPVVAMRWCPAAHSVRRREEIHHISEGTTCAAFTECVRGFAQRATALGRAYGTRRVSLVSPSVKLRQATTANPSGVAIKTVCGQYRNIRAAQPTGPRNRLLDSSPNPENCDAALTFGATKTCACTPEK